MDGITIFQSRVLSKPASSASRVLEGIGFSLAQSDFISILTRAEQVARRSLIVLACVRRVQYKSRSAAARNHMLLGSRSSYASVAMNSKAVFRTSGGKTGPSSAHDDIDFASWMFMSSSSSSGTQLSSK